MPNIDLDTIKNEILSDPIGTFPETDPDLLYVWKCYRSKWVSPYDAWFDKDLISKAIDNIKYRIEEEDSRVIRLYDSCTSLHDYYRLVLSRFTIAKIAPKVTEFSPSELINIINRLYNSGIDVTHVYDPFSGLGGRAEGCRLLGIKYEGYDINPNCINYAKKLYPDTKDCYTLRDIFKDKIYTEGIVITSPPWDNAEVWPMDGYDMPIKDITWWINNTIRHVVSPMYIFHINKEIDNNDIEIPVGMKGVNILLQSTTGYFGYKKYLYIVCDKDLPIDNDIGEWEIYKISILDKIYIGQHKRSNNGVTDIGVSYFGSGRLLHSYYDYINRDYSICKYEILYLAKSDREADDKEIELIAKYKYEDQINNTNICINISPGGKRIRDIGDWVWYNNSEDSGLFYKYDPIPDGWVPGRLDPFHAIGSEWYNNGTEEYRFYPGLIPDGWTKGRLPNSNDMIGRKSYTNGEIDIYRHPGTEPSGFWLGRSDNADRSYYSRNKLVYHNPDTLDWGYYDMDNQPDGWIRGAPIGCGNTGMKYYNNGVEEGLYYPDTQPEGWVLGKISDSPNSGKICYTNGIDNKYYYPNEPVPDGWYLGMTKDIINPYNIGMVWYTNGKSECQYVEGNQPDGWSPGRLTSGTVMYNNGFEWKRIPKSMIEYYEKLGWIQGQGGYYASNSLGCRRLFKYDKSKENGGLPPFWSWDS